MTNVQKRRNTDNNIVISPKKNSLTLNKRLANFIRKHNDSMTMDDVSYASLVSRLYKMKSSLYAGPSTTTVFFLLIWLMESSSMYIYFMAALCAVGGWRILLTNYFDYDQAITNRRGFYERWDNNFFYGAIAFSTALGIFSTTTLIVSHNMSVHFLVLILVVGYTSSVSARNAGRVLIGYGQIISCITPITIAIAYNGYSQANNIYYFLCVAMMLYVIATINVMNDIRNDRLSSAQSAASLHAQARTDVLTNLPNRLAFEERIQILKHEKQPFTVIMVDLDDFKDVNDTKGHDAGDNVIKETASRLRSTLRESDLVARIGGDEFIAILLGTLEDGTNTPLARIEKCFSEAFKIGDEVMYLTASIGVADSSQMQKEREDIMKASDIALYEAKIKGKNQVCIYTAEMEERGIRRHTLLNELRHSIDTGNFKMFFQPIVDIKTKAIVSLEALMRWDSPTYGPISPVEFIPLAESSRLIHDLTFVSIDKSIEHASTWPRKVSVSINISARMFYEANVLKMKIIESLMRHRVNPKRVELELTETALIENFETVENFISDMNAIGIRVNLDDFGVGHSSMSYIQKLDFSKIKVDKSFTDGILTNKKSRAIIASVSALCSAIGANMIVEGIETEEQAAALEKCQVSYGQGYLFDKPLHANIILSKLRNQFNVDNINNDLQNVG